MNIRVHGTRGLEHVHDEDGLKNHCSLWSHCNRTTIARDMRISKKSEKEREPNTSANKDGGTLTPVLPMVRFLVVDANPSDRLRSAMRAMLAKDKRTCGGDSSKTFKGHDYVSIRVHGARAMRCYSWQEGPKEEPWFSF